MTPLELGPQAMAEPGAPAVPAPAALAASALAGLVAPSTAAASRAAAASPGARRSEAPLHRTRLPAAAAGALADLVAAGFGMGEALATLPRGSLRRDTARRLEAELARLSAGGALDATLDRLGLEITCASIRGCQARSADLQAALRADAAALEAGAGALRRTRLRIQLFALALGGLAASTAILSFLLVPAMIRQSLGHLPANARAVPALVQFEGFRNLWLAAGGGFLILLAAAATVAAGALGRARCHRLLQNLRLALPWLRAHAVAASRARLLEALACEQQAGLPADDTLRRLARREPVPRLAAALDLAAARLAAGDAWTACLAGTLLDAPDLADLNALAGRGAQPTRGLRWAADQSRERAVVALRRAVGAVAAIVLIPAFAYLLVLAHAASTTAAVAQVESLRLEIESFGDEVERVVGGPGPDASPQDQ